MIQKQVYLGREDHSKEIRRKIYIKGSIFINMRSILSKNIAIRMGAVKYYIIPKTHNGTQRRRTTAIYIKGKIEEKRRIWRNPCVERLETGPVIPETISSINAKIMTVILVANLNTDAA